MPVIGFAAAPWTLACYMIEGRTRGDISRAKQMLREQPQVVRELLDRIARATAQYLKSQIAAGASVIQLFDTWAGELSRAEYDAFELPATQNGVRIAGPSGSPENTFRKRLGAFAGEPARNPAPDVLSVDWKRIWPKRARLQPKTGRKVALQGNVDPNILLGPRKGCAKRAQAAVEKTGGLGHILNLGHGILPTTPVENARAFVEAGQAARVPARAGIA